MRTSGIGGLPVWLLAGAGISVSLAAAATAVVLRGDRHIATLIASYGAADSTCRGSADDEARMYEACATRARLMIRLKANGWCLGEGAVSDADAIWAPCSASKTPSADESVARSDDPISAATAGSPGIPTYTKEEFVGLVQGRTMAEVRQAIGEPSNVEDMSYDNRILWYYWDTKLKIYDPDAGIMIQNSPSVSFSTFTGRVVDVRF